MGWGEAALGHRRGWGILRWGWVGYNSRCTAFSGPYLYFLAHSGSHENASCLEYVKWWSRHHMSLNALSFLMRECRYDGKADFYLEMRMFGIVRVYNPNSWIAIPMTRTVAKYVKTQRKNKENKGLRALRFAFYDFPAFCCRFCQQS